MIYLFILKKEMKMNKNYKKKISFKKIVCYIFNGYCFLCK